MKIECDFLQRNQDVALTYLVRLLTQQVKYIFGSLQSSCVFHHKLHWIFLETLVDGHFQGHLTAETRR